VPAVSGYALTATTAGVMSWASAGSQWTTSGSNIYYTTGSVGVGTTSPAVSFEVDAASGEAFRVAATGANGGIYSRYIGGSPSTANFYVGVDNAAGAFSGVGPVGILWSQSNQGIAFGTNNTQRALLDSSGNLGVGTIAPNSKIEAYTTSAGAQAVLTLQQADNTAGNSWGIDFRRTAGAGSNVIRAKIFAVREGNDATALAFSYTTSGGTITEGMRLDSSGSLLVGTTSSTIGTDSALVAFKRATSGYSLILGSAQSGSVSYMIKFTYDNTTGTGLISTTNTTVSYTTSSDYRLKENVQPMTSALDTVSLLKPCTYKWKVDGSAGQGFIAHELAEVCPQAVVGEKDALDENGNPSYQGVDTSFLVATLTAAIQELSIKLDEVNTANSAMAARIAALEAK